MSFWGYSRNPHLTEMQERLAAVTEVRAETLSLSRLFTLLFREQVMAHAALGTPRGENYYVASRSDWTYHVAVAASIAASLLGLNCRFEALGRLDAAIETYQDKPQSVLLIEWEWDYQDVFGQGKELDKLRRGLKRMPGADGLLFTYCPESEYFDYARRVVEFWQSKLTAAFHPELYLAVMVFELAGSIREWRFLRTIEVLADHVRLWDDLAWA